MPKQPRFDREEMTDLNLRLPTVLRDRLAQAAIARNEYMRQIVIRAIQTELNRLDSTHEGA